MVAISDDFSYTSSYIAYVIYMNVHELYHQTKRVFILGNHSNVTWLEPEASVPCVNCIMTRSLVVAFLFYGFTAQLYDL